MIEDVRDLARVQLGIDRDHGQARMPAGEQQLDILGRVPHHESDAIARRRRGRREVAAKRSRRAEERRRRLASAREHGGELRYASRPGDTAFSLYLPMGHAHD